MPFHIIRNDITKVKADAIVNTANPEPVIGAGTDTAIYCAAGKTRLLKARRRIGPIEPGQTAYTPAFSLTAKFILHTVGPQWIDGKNGEFEILRSCYRKSMELADELGCESIAFPLMATGSYGFPKAEALQIALDEINRFLLTHDMEVILVVFDRRAFELSGKLIGEIEEYIDEHSVKEIRTAEYGSSRQPLRRESRLRTSNVPLPEEPAYFASRNAYEDSETGSEPERDHLSALSGAAVPKQDKLPAFSPKSLEELLTTPTETFQQCLFRLIDERGLDDVTVYKKANIDRKVFSKIRCNEAYKPKKKTAIAFAIALELDMETMADLLSRAEIAFSPSSKFDMIITYFVTNEIYDIFEINAALFKYGQPILGE